MGKICLIYNFAQHYRSNIFMLMDKELGCDFVFGDSCGDIEKMNYALLRNKVTEVHNFPVWKFIYQKGVPRQIFNQYENYIVLGQATDLSTWLLLLLSKFSKKKIYLWTHGWYGKETAIQKIIKKIFFGLSDGILLYGDYAKQLMVQEGFDKAKLFVINNSLDYDKQLKIRHTIEKTNIYANQFKNDNLNLIFVGRLTKVKNLDMILNMIERFKNEGQIINITFIGNGEQRDHLSTLASYLDIIEQVWFYGACYDETKLSELIYNADLCVSPGNVGLTAIHALSYGCPVITHNNFPMQMPEFEAIKSGVTGDFFEYNDEESLYKTVKHWFATQKDRENICKLAYSEVDERWQPYHQIEVIKQILKS